VSNTTIRLKTKLRWRTRNHLHSIYFSALAVGAGITGGLHAFYYSKAMNKKASFSFKGMEVVFFKKSRNRYSGLPSKFETNLIKPLC